LPRSKYGYVGMATIHLRHPEKEVERENVFVKATGWVAAYDVVSHGPYTKSEKVEHVSYPPRRVSKIVGEVTHARSRKR